MSLEIKITSVKCFDNEMIEADLVSFEVINGEGDKRGIYELIENNASSACNIYYCEDNKAGNFVDMNFEFKQDQVVISS